MKAKAIIRLKFLSARRLETMKACLQPEVNNPSSLRARVKLETQGTTLILTAEADDTVSLRSTLNAYLRWISSTMNVVETLDCLS